VRAALLHEVGGVPRVEEVAEPVPGEGEVVVEMVASTVNPADLAIAAGTFYAGHPPLPYSPGLEAVGRVGDRLVLATGSGLGVSRSGTMADRFALPESALTDLPDGTDPATAVALRTAGLAGWLPITWRAQVQPGEIVLVLGATGTAGMVALQAARSAGAAKVVAAGRNPAKLAAVAGLADETVTLDGDDLADRLLAACAPGASVVYDPLWGKPVAAALAACAPRARIVQVGASSGPTAELPSSLVRGRQLSILGYTNFGVPAEALTEAYLDMVQRANAGDLVVSTIAVDLAEVATAWEGTRAATGKYVLWGAAA
jgi:NADPH2:quinone reductase